MRLHLSSDVQYFDENLQVDNGHSCSHSSFNVSPPPPPPVLIIIIDDTWTCRKFEGKEKRV